MTSTLFGDFEGHDVAAVFAEIKGSLPLYHVPREGEELTVVAVGRLGPPKFQRKNGLLYRIHPLVVTTAGEAADAFADEAADFLAQLAKEQQAEADTGNRGQLSINDVINDEDGEQQD